MNSPGSDRRLKTGALAPIIVLAAFYPAGVYGCEEEIDYGVPFLQGTTSTSTTIVWETQTPGPSRLTYWISGSDDEKIHLVSNEQSVLLHEVTITNLNENTRYEYRISEHTEEHGDQDKGGRDDHDKRNRDDSTHGGDDGEGERRAFEFTTAGGPQIPFSFTVLGDTHGNGSIYSSVLERAIREEPASDFVIHTGDAVNNGSDREAWFFEYLEPGRELMVEVPVYATMGNHEEDSYWYYYYHAYPEPENRYSFVWGNSFFLVVDTNQDFGIGSPQYQWIIEELSSEESARATWRFVSFHHPPYGEGWNECGRFDGDPDVRRVLVPLVGRYDVDVVFNGHVHGYERGESGGVLYVTTGGGGGALDRFCQDWSHIAVSKYVHHFVRVDVIDKTLSLFTFSPQGAVIDEVTLSK